ncbi:hypothetical protein M8J76_001848 [Diaphorina citri]|nr:hypothetical protein M8J75_000447 [Diaphorina citri]KAI5744385.1 hypothetical protein M8J76_001848 [Diaphorina citri]KAI5751954.1 hypothetical protein M8J77_012444 [Diaphorina citri]
MNTDTTPLIQPAAPEPTSDQLKERPDFEVLTTVFYYCFTIIVMPVVTFFASKYLIFSGVFGVDSVSCNVYSAIAAIIAVHISLAAFIYRAYSEAGTGKPQKQD